MAIVEKTILNGETTKQELFDHVCRHLAEQKRRCIGKDIRECLYRCEDLACAIGSCIADSDYDPKMDDGNHGASDIIEHWFPTAWKLEVLAGQLQRDHDESKTSEVLRDRLKMTASNNNLNPKDADLITEWEYYP
jgi:hypothetical protein